MGEFEWPWEFNFPPFFTVQPNETTRKLQMDAWASLVSDYCRHHRQTKLSIESADTSELFSNKKINRKLSGEGVLAVAEHMVSVGKAQWLEPQKVLLVLWRSRDEWASIIYNFAVNAGLTHTVCTMFELVQGDDSTQEEFYGQSIDVLKVFLKTLEEQGRAEIIGDNGDGVKFF